MNHRSIISLLHHSAGSIAASLALTSISTAADKPFSKIVTFGDSLSDTGNAYMLTGGLYPSSPPNAVGRISNGPIWVEHLAESLGMQLQMGDQYAVAGARSDEGNFSHLAYGLTVLENTGLKSQIAAYLQDSGPHGVDPNALHTIWIGPNDIFTTLTFGGNMNLTIMESIQNTAQAVATLSGNGAKHILVANLPDLGLTPFGLSMGQGFSAQLSFLSDIYNAGLQQALNSLEGAGIRTIRFDSAGLIAEISADPASFGLTNATGQALISAGDDDDFLFWDSVHPTTAGHRVIADRVVRDLVAFYSPRRGNGQGPGLVRSLNGLVSAPGRK